MKASLYRTLLIVILIAGSCLRFINLDWDSATPRLHPDEEFILLGASRISFFDQLHPGFHDYNGFSVYLAATVIRLLPLIYPFVYPEDIHFMTLAMRIVSAAISVGTLILFYAVAQKILNRTSVIISMLLLSFSVIHFQQAHFYTTDTLLTFYIVWMLVVAVRAQKKLTIAQILSLSLASGLALGTKLTAVLFLFIPLAIIVMQPKIVSFRSRMSAILIFILFTLLSFILASPYSIIDFQGFLERSRYLQDIASGRTILYWMSQFIDQPWWFWWKTLFFAFGPSLAIIGTIACVASTILCIRTSRYVLATLAVFPLLYILFLNLQFMQFVRYQIVLAPFFALFTAFLIQWISHRFPSIGKIIVVMVLLPTMLWGTAYISIYLAPNTRAHASSWIFANIPDQSTILLEAGNYHLPLPLNGKIPHQYQVRIIDFSLPESESKIIAFADALHSSDYIIQGSPIKEMTFTRLSHRFPISARYFVLLNEGRLGFDLIYEHSSFPRLGPFEFNDTAAEETFSVFDHPKIRIYKKVTPMNTQKYQELLRSSATI